MAHVDIISVSQYLDRLNATLKVERAKVLGEISGIQEYPGRSYMYFSVKDSKDQSSLRCFMWKRDFTLSGVALKEGTEVVISGYPSVYKPNGGLTMQVDAVELVGEGALKLAYDELKKKLEAEGLFSKDRKRELSAYPHRIGVITSKSGAVINDFLSNIGKFGFEILFVDSKVEGQDAIRDLLAGIAVLKDQKLDALVIMRGGGSLESFMAFNNENLVRAVAEFPVPVLTGIGHDKDAPLVSLVSDINVSTPTAVANLLNSSWSQALSVVTLSEEKILSQFQSGLQSRGFFLENSASVIEGRFNILFETFRRAEQKLSVATMSIEMAIRRVGENLTRQGVELVRGFTLLSDNLSESLAQSEKTLVFINPERQLARGYSIARYKGKVLRSIQDIQSGEHLDILLSDGIIHTQIL